jgi:hypothetical protein
MTLKVLKLKLKKQVPLQNSLTVPLKVLKQFKLKELIN